MKKLFIILGIVLALVVGAAIVIPMVLKEPITEAVKKEVNRNLNATVDFESVNISILRSFPDLYVGIDEFSITGKDAFEGRTLLFLNTLALDVDVMSAFNGSPVVNEILLNGGLVNVVVTEDGKASYDIVPEIADGEAADVDTTLTDVSEDGTFALQLNKLSIVDLEIMYADQSKGTSFSTSGLNLSLSGDFSAARTTLKTTTMLESVKAAKGQTAYLNNATLELLADIDADIKGKSYTFNNNEFRVNGLHLALDGSISLPNENDVVMDLAYSASRTEFKEILSLIPAIYTKDFKDMQASGSLALNGTVKGVYNEHDIPAFTANLKVDNGKFQYPELPKSVNGIAIDLTVANPGNDVDNTVIDLEKFDFELGENPFKAKALLKTPISDPDLNASLKGKIDLSSLVDAIPLEAGDQLRGSIIADVTLKGKQSDLDAGKYEKFDATGELIFMDILYGSASVAVPIQVKYAQFRFSPRYLELASFDATAGRSDFKMNGRITNYLDYMLADGTLKGNFVLKSNLLDGTELAGSSDETGEEPENAEELDSGMLENDESKPFVVPNNLDVRFQADVKKLIYDDIDLQRVNGNIIVRNGKADLRGLSFNTLGGSVSMNGYYDSRNEEKPKLNYDLKVQDIVLKDAYATFGTVRKLAPIAEKTEGRASVNFNINGVMKSATEVEYGSLNGGGQLSSKSLKIKGTEALAQVAKVVRIDAFKNPELKDMKLTFGFMNGRVHVKPFDVKIGPVSANIFGSHGFDETMDYVMSTSVPTSVLGNEANAIIDGLVSQANSLGADFSAGNTIDVDILIKGTFKDPKITPAFKGSKGAKNPVEDLKAKAEEELKRQQEALEQKAKEEAEKLKREAEERARKEAERLRKQAEEEAKKKAKDALKGLFGKP